MGDLRDVLIQQKRELAGQLANRYVSRSIDPARFANDLIKVVSGPRRAGKSFFCMHLLNEMGNFGYVNFDDDRLSGVKDYDEIVKHILMMADVLSNGIIAQFPAKFDKP